MKLGQIFFTASIAWCLLPFSACNKAGNALPTDGAIDLTAYTNSFFGFAFTLPTNWIVAEKEITDSMQSKAAQDLEEKLKKDKHNRASAVEDLGKKMRVLLMVSRYPMGSASNANVVFMSMPSSIGSRSLSSQQVIHNVDRGMQNRGTRMMEIDKVLIGGQEFFHAAYSKPAHGLVTRQDYFTMVHRDNALTIVLTGLNEEDIKELSEFLSQISFAGK